MRTYPAWIRPTLAEHRLRATYRLILLMWLGVTTLGTCPGWAQDPVEPASNFGLTNVLDGAPPGPGTYYQQYVQVYTASSVRGGAGEGLGNARLSSTLLMQQLAVITPLKALGGNVGFTLLQPIVSLNPQGSPGGGAWRANPSLLGDLIVGPNIQWFNRKLLGLPFFHRLEVDVMLPTGGYDPTYAINPSAHFVSLEPHYTFTWFLTDRLSTSQRHHYMLNGTQSDTQTRCGALYHANYSVEYRVAGSFRVAVVGYYIQQTTGDRYRGDATYFQRTYGITNDRERAFALGPGLAFGTPGGVFVELKAMWETAVQNRPQGSRVTARAVVPLGKQLTHPK